MFLTPLSSGFPGSDPSSALDAPSVDPTALAVAAGGLAVASALAILRRSLAQSLPDRVVEGEADPARRARLGKLARKLDRLATSALVIETAAALAFALGVLRIGGEPADVGWLDVALTIAVCAPVLWFASDALARAVALKQGDALLRAMLPTFWVLQLPLEAVAWSFEILRRGVLRTLGLRGDPERTRQIVAGLREVIEEAELSGHLDETEKELIGNVMEFRDVDAAAVMTPRTEIAAVDVEAGVLAAAQKIAESGHSRVPVFDGTLDSVVGTISARDLVQVMASEDARRSGLKELVRPAYFVPESKRISELFAELRRQKIELAVVLDEYGGTAGIVTIGDILREIVGDLPDEFDEEKPSPVRELEGGAAEVDASLHVSEVNEALGLDLPEAADFETLGGFVLARLGRFPQQGERFSHGSAEFEIVESSDRRVLKVRVRKLAGAASG